MIIIIIMIGRTMYRGVAIGLPRDGGAPRDDDRADGRLVPHKLHARRIGDHVLARLRGHLVRSGLHCSFLFSSFFCRVFILFFIGFSRGSYLLLLIRFKSLALNSYFSGIVY